MAEETITTIVDDIDQSTPASRVDLSINDNHWQIDLNEQHYQELCDALSPYLKHARRVREPRRKRKSIPAATVRKWAQEHGIEVKPEGRLPEHAIEAYRNRNQRT